MKIEQMRKSRFVLFQKKITIPFRGGLLPANRGNTSARTGSSPPLNGVFLRCVIFLILILAFISLSSAQTSARDVQMKTLTVEEFQKRFAEIKKQGWVKTKRKGNTGIGQTLEQLLQLEENNFALPDLGFAELKSHRIGSSSMVTLFTFDRKAWKMNPLDAVRKYGTKDKNGRLGLFFTLSFTPNESRLFLRVENKTVSVCHTSGEILAEWNTETLSQKFKEKMPSLVFVHAESEMREGVEWFKYERAELLTEPSSEKFLEQIKKGNVVIDLRLHDKGTSARNHGTAFRTREDNLSSLFKNVREL